MPDEADDTGTDTAAAAAVAKEATALGWSPKEQWRGDPEKWIDAEAFVARGHEVMPILQANNRKLQQKLDGMQAELSRVTNLLTVSQESIEALKEFNSEATLQQAEQTRKDLLTGIKAAKESDDIETEVTLTEQLGEVNSVIKSAKADEGKAGEKKKPNGAGGPPAVDPAIQADFAAWTGENPWYGVDKRKTRLANVIADEIRSDPANARLVGRAFLDRVVEEVTQELGAAPARTDKVEGSRGGGRGGSGGKSYADLPADAKVACSKYARQLVGEGRAYKTEAEWQKAYTKKYFAESEENV